MNIKFQRKALVLGFASAALLVSGTAFAVDEDRLHTRQGAADVVDAVTSAIEDGSEGAIPVFTESAPVRAIIRGNGAVLASEDPPESVLVGVIQAASAEGMEVPETVDETLGGALSGVAGQIGEPGDGEPGDEGAIFVDALPVTILGTVLGAGACEITETDVTFDFATILLTGDSATSSESPITLTCQPDSGETSIFLSTNDDDPTLGTGSGDLTAIYTDSENVDQNVNVEVFHVDGADGTKIGSTQPAGTATDDTPTTIDLFATLDINQIEGGLDGTLADDGDSFISVWIQ